MKLLIDVNLSPRWVDYLGGRGFQAVHWSSVGALDAPDCAIVAYAMDHDFVVFTHDLDFSAILAATRGAKPSVVQIRGDAVDPENLGPSLVSALRSAAADLAAGALLTVDPNRARLRILPLGRLG